MSKKKGVSRRHDKNKPQLKETFATGILRVHVRGFGFLQPEEKEKFPEDIFIPKQYIYGAVDGDRVEVKVNTECPSEKGLDGRVVHILNRGRTHVGGTIVTLLSKKQALAYVPLLGPNIEMLIHKSPERDFKIGDRMVIRVLEWGSKNEEPQGEMSTYIGHISDPSCDVNALIHEYGLESTFSPAVIKEAKSFGQKVTARDLEGREDLRELECFTIDPETARDFDDALSLSRDEKGHYHLAVHIADVSHYVKPGTALDEQARLRCNSVYFPGSVIPMLPHELSSHLCSLQPNVNRLAATIFMHFNPDGDLLNYRIARSVIKSQKRFSYKEAKEVLDGTKKSKYKDTLFLMCDLCHRLKKKRCERGSIEFSLPSVQVYVNDKGVPQKIELVEYDITHQLVEEFMLKANEIVATHLAKAKKPLTYRVHEEPSPENIRDFAILANAFGFALSKTPTTQELQEMFDKVKTSPFGQFLSTAFIRSMRLASYSIQNIGHYGLGLEHYTHFTSPIRRYIDLVVHRVLFDEIDPKDHLETIALQCSEKERLAAKAENSAILLKKLRLLDSDTKENPHKRYEAIITQVKPFGFAFEVLEFLIEGFVPLSSLEEDYFVFDEANLRYDGRHSQRRIALGDRIEVTLEYVNFIVQEARWQFVGNPVKKKRRK